MKKGKKWIQKAIRKPGNVRRYLLRTYGGSAFTERGTIRPAFLDRAEKRAKKEGRRKLMEEIILAKRLRGFNKRRR